MSWQVRSLIRLATPFPASAFCSTTYCQHKCNVCLKSFFPAFVSCMLLSACWLRPWPEPSFVQLNISVISIRAYSRFLAGAKNDTVHLDHRVKAHGKKIRANNSRNSTDNPARIKRRHEERTHSYAGNGLVEITKSNATKTPYQLYNAHNWRQRIVTFEQLDFESDLDSSDPLCKGRRLVDNHSFRGNRGLWQELFFFRLRIYGHTGAKVIWKRFWESPEMKTREIYHRKKLWIAFLELGLKDPEVFEQLIGYVAEIHTALGLVPPEPPNFYCTVMGHILKEDHEAATRIHKRLEFLHPSRDELISLAISLGDFEPGTRALQLLTKDVTSFGNVYSCVVPALCERGYYKAARLWHHFLVERKDLPLSQAVVMPLVEHLRAEHGEDEAQKIIDEMVKAEITIMQAPSRATNEAQLEQRQSRSPRLMEFVEPRYPTVKRFSDQFCAKLFATKFFGIKSIINGLHIAQVEAIGPLSVREILLRTTKDERCDARLTLRYLELLSAAGISIGTSTFCQLILKVAQSGDSRLLYDIAVCDQHPDVFDDWQLQESLLAQYQRMGDVRQANRTLAIRTFHEWGKKAPISRMNVLLRSATIREDDEGMRALLAEMSDQGCPATKKTRLFMLERMVLCSKPTILAITNLVNIWKRLLISGDAIDIEEWRKPLTILGKLGELDYYENLALWLAKWYVDKTFRDSQMSTCNSLPGRPNYPLSPSQEVYQLLFSDANPYTILALGFFRARSDGTKHLIGRTFEQRVTNLVEHQSLWGLRFLTKLRDSRVPVSARRIQRACGLCLMDLFGPGRPISRFRARARKNIVAGLPEYVLAMERVWGRDLFSRKASVEEFCRDLILQAEVRWNRRQGL